MRIKSVNISTAKGTPKTPCHRITVTSEGFAQDAHAGAWHRQISLLGEEAYASLGIPLDGSVPIPYGRFAENITTLGAPSAWIEDLKHCHPGDRFRCGDIVLEVTQIGKKCHGDGCTVKQQTGRCVMPTEGIFVRVVTAEGGMDAEAVGTLGEGDELTYEPRAYRFHVITLSDRAFQGIYEDKSGPYIRQYLADYCAQQGWPCQITYSLLPDDATRLQATLAAQDANNVDAIFTTGGTGIAPTDITIQTIKPQLTKEIPGIMEYIRCKYGAANPNALASGSVAGVLQNALLFALPGSMNAVREYMEEIGKCLKHLIYTRLGFDFHG